MENLIKEYLDFYKKCYKKEKEWITETPQLVEFRKGKVYEMEMVIRDLQRILDGDIFFRVEVK